ncbi:hypothetical protein FIBSPDRAFT_945589 [Athelia psychrophila]|uniref:Uncharacterized protein n=1 Tax=Athelia psychrophila TaxID=1759441 RepID=A0A166TIP0_9AGAM|nr:hypothetical protein FIBSPDRAFT_945589 [Fibularhizoctonia sp. CBS 109695]
MQLFTPTKSLPSRLALVLVLSVLSLGASAAPYQHAKRCNSALYMDCVAAEDCCPFSYCQNLSGDPNVVTGSCFPGFTETPYVKTVTPETALSPPPQPTGWQRGTPIDCGPHWWDNIFC